ncbi:MAG: hypothetical protein NUV32_03600 [Exilispira sp.]|jgi:hypothetical protein|nr:hypothetical protein [Exilispira sp.]
MKRSIIILIALVLIVSLPVFASTPTEENAPTATSEDTMFLDMTQINEEELTHIFGQVQIAEYDYNITGPTPDISEYEKTWSEFLRILFAIGRAIGRSVDLVEWCDSIILGIENGWTINEIISYHLFCNH